MNLWIARQCLPEITSVVFKAFSSVVHFKFFSSGLYCHIVGKAKWALDCVPAAPLPI